MTVSAMNNATGRDNYCNKVAWRPVRSEDVQWYNLHTNHRGVVHGDIQID